VTFDKGVPEFEIPENLLRL